MKIPIFYKTFAWYLLIIIILSSLIIFGAFSIVKDYYIEVLNNNLKSLSTVLTPEIINFIKEEKYSELDKFVKSIGKKIKIRITVIRKDGMVLADSEYNPSLMGSHRNRPEFVSAIDSGYGKSIRYSKTLNKSMLYVAIPILNEGNLIGVLRTSLFLDDIDILLKELHNKILRISIVVVVLSLFGAVIFSRNISKPINILKRAYEEITSGNFNKVVILKNRDEFKDLADGLNNMSERMKNIINEFVKQKEEQRNLFALYLQ